MMRRTSAALRESPPVMPDMRQKNRTFFVFRLLTNCKSMAYYIVGTGLWLGIFIMEKMTKKAAARQTAKVEKAVKPSAGSYHFEGKDQEYYELLLKMAQNLQKQMRSCAENVLDASNSDKRGTTTHMADTSYDNSWREMELKMLSEDGDTLQLIDAAIERLANGTYGKCLDCGEQIAEGRLKIRPHALYCTKCKSKREKEM